MAKKPTPTEETPEPKKLDWPETTEKRNLSCILNDLELKSASSQLARTVPEILELEAQAKSAADNWKAKIKAVECQQTVLANTIRDGREDRQVTCEWAFECSGIDSGTGEHIFHPEKKSLFRVDTGEFIESRDITSDDRQMVANLDDDTDVDDGE